MFDDFVYTKKSLSFACRCAPGGMRQVLVSVDACLSHDALGPSAQSVPGGWLGWQGCGEKELVDPPPLSSVRLRYWVRVRWTHKCLLCGKALKVTWVR